MAFSIPIPRALSPLLESATACGLPVTVSSIDDEALRDALGEVVESGRVHPTYSMTTSGWPSSALPKAPHRRKRGRVELNHLVATHPQAIRATEGSQLLVLTLDEPWLALVARLSGDAALATTANEADQWGYLAERVANATGNAPTSGTESTRRVRSAFLSWIWHRFDFTADGLWAAFETEFPTASRWLDALSSPEDLARRSFSPYARDEGRYDRVVQQIKTAAVLWQSILTVLSPLALAENSRAVFVDSEILVLEVTPATLADTVCKVQMLAERQWTLDLPGLRPRVRVRTGSHLGDLTAG